jgi:intein/homing endonuclease
VGEVSPVAYIVAQEGSERAEATGFYNGGIQPTIRITTESGYVLEATANHRVRSIDVDGTYIWYRLGELEQGEYVALARGAMLFGADQEINIVYQRRRDNKLRLPEKLTPLFARFLGYFVSEGNIDHGRSSSTVVISNADREIVEDLRRISQEIFGVLPHETTDRNGVISIRWYCSRLVELLEQLGTGSGAANKHIPDIIMQGSYESVTEFLRAYFEGDGSISKSFISVASKSYHLIQQFQALLLNLSIVCRLEQRDIDKYGTHYRLLLIGKDSRRAFAEHVGFISTRKRQRLAELIPRQVTFESIFLPYQISRLQRLYPQTKNELKETIHTCIRTKSPAVALTYRRLSKIIDQFSTVDDPDIRELKEHQQRNLFYDRIKTIEHSENRVFDLVVPQNNTYIANGFVSHNTVVFGVIYGISAFGLAARTDLSRSEAQGLIDALFARFPGLRTYIDDTLASGRDIGYVRSLFGRRRSMPDLRASGARRQAAEREAINAPIQATAADIMKIAMIRVDEALRHAGLGARMLLQVHDELIFEAPAAEVDQVVQLVRAQMEDAYPDLCVPLRVDVEIGPNWEEMQEIA